MHRETTTHGTALHLVAAVFAAALTLGALTGSASAAVSFGGPTYFAAGTNPYSVAVGDLDGDSNPDLAVANQSSHDVSILLGDGDGDFSTPTNFAAGFQPVSVAVGDFDADLDPDLAVAHNLSDEVSILLGDGDGDFSTPTNFAVGDGPVSIAVGDLDGDSTPDLAVANGDSSDVSILIGDGSGGFTGPTNFGSGFQPVSVAVGDFDGDSNPDLAVANYFSNDVSILLGDGGGFTGPTNFAVGTAPQSVAVGDLDGDSNPDLAVANYGSNDVSILLGDGSGDFTGPTNFGSGFGFEPISVAVSDLDGDSRLDLAVANNGSDNVSILLGDGSGGFTGPIDFGVGFLPISVAVGDFDGDSRPDLAVANYFSNDVSILLNRPGYPRPKGATPIYAPLVVAYQACTAPDRVHASPLAYDSCASPAQSSSYVTVGTRDANGEGTKMVGSVRYKVIVGDPGTTADEADVDLAVSITDVRRQGDLSDYTGELQVNAPLRITDRLNGAQNLSGAVQDISFPVTVACAATADTSVGSTCSLATTFDAVTPGAVPEGAYSIWQLGAVEVRDGGADGLVSTAGNPVFLRQGIFVP